jgi:hypothetical protein
VPSVRSTQRSIRDGDPRAATQLGDVVAHLLQSKKSFGARQAAFAAQDKVLAGNHKRTKHSARVTADALETLGPLQDGATLRKRYGITMHGIQSGNVCSGSFATCTSQQQVPPCPLSHVIVVATHVRLPVRSRRSSQRAKSGQRLGMRTEPLRIIGTSAGHYLGDSPLDIRNCLGYIGKIPLTKDAFARALLEAERERFPRSAAMHCAPGRLWASSGPARAGLRGARCTGAGEGPPVCTRWFQEARPGAEPRGQSLGEAVVGRRKASAPPPRGPGGPVPLP